MAPFTSNRSLYTQIVHELGLRIVRGDVKSGNAFPTEADLSQEMGVSRTVTREAVKVLTEKGLVISRPKTGTLVQPRTKPLHRAGLDAIRDHQSQTACDAMRYPITRAQADIHLIVSQSGFQKIS